MVYEPKRGKTKLVAGNHRRENPRAVGTENHLRKFTALGIVVVGKLKYDIRHRSSGRSTHRYKPETVELSSSL